MNYFVEAFRWLTNAANWHGQGSIPSRVFEHLLLTACALLIASLIALPLGVAIGHIRRGRGLVGAIAGAARAIPTLGLVTLLGLLLGIGVLAPLIALVVLAIPSILAGAYSGVESVDAVTVDAARAVGFSPLQVIFRVEIPLAGPLIVGGLRAATLQVVATATLAAYTTDMGLGRYLFSGLKTRDYVQMLGGSILVTFIAIVLEICLSRLQKWTTQASHPTPVSLRNKF